MGLTDCVGVDDEHCSDTEGRRGETDCDDGFYASLANTDTDEERSNAQRASRIVRRSLATHDLRNLNTNSWDSVVIITMLARSCEWNFFFTTLAIRQVGFALLALVLQVLLLDLFWLSMRGFRILAGQPHLCNFGMNFPLCPNARDCIGPGGTTYTDTSLFSDFDTWSTRMFFRDSLLAIFNATEHRNLTHAVQRNVDPGEYGLENAVCRWVCVFILGAQCQIEINEMLNVSLIIRRVPTRSDSWLVHRGSSDGEPCSKDIGDVSFRIAGIPLGWKICFIVLVVGSRAYATLRTMALGTEMMMWTGSVEEMILNSLALTFILGLNDSVFKALSSRASHELLAMIEPWNHERSFSVLKFVCTKLAHISGVTFCFSYGIMYHLVHCVTTPNGSLVSRATYPTNLQEPFSVLKWLVPVLDRLADTTYPNASWCPPPDLGVDEPCHLR